MIVTYDGSAFFGFQIQPTGPTVQGILESALENILGEKVRVHGSGRTDTGVHALGQVVSFKTWCPIPVDKLIQAMNRTLPKAVRIRSVEEVDPEFHARFSAKSKMYRYLIKPVTEPSPFLERFVCQVECSLNRERMRAGVGEFPGTHDFSSFTKSPAGLRDPVREIFQADIHQDGDVIIFDVIGSGFLHNMVRNMAKALILIGSSRMDPHEIQELYRNQNRSRLGAPASPGGLYLMKVMY
jgi:tRNA pseudouridine38-40 synthase